MRIPRLAAFMVLAVTACGTGVAATTTTTSLPPVTTTTTEPTTTTTNSLWPGDRATPITTDDLVVDLEDGTYLVFVDHVFIEGLTGGPEIHFDLAVWFGGEEAAAAAAEDGAESPPPNDYYIRNLDPTVLVREVDPDVMVTSVWYHYEETQELASQEITYDELVEALTGETDDSILAMRFSPWWITISDGIVVAIEEQYVP
ncbi:MAG: hypothetical protein L0Z63_00930 [Actinobacteria bacterium]|nr:hypothetical protein [Actinomycetota bacterium]